MIEELEEANPNAIKYDMFKIKVRLRSPFPLSIMNKNYLRESFLIIKYKHKNFSLKQFVDSLILRKIFVFLFWIYYIDRF